MLRTAVFALLLLTVLVGPPRAQASAPRVCGELHAAGDIRVLLVWGSDRERGRAEGFLLGPELREVFQSFLLETVVKAPWLWNRVVRRVVTSKVAVPGWVTERCEGLLAGMQARDPALLRVASLDREFVVDDLVAATVVPDLMGLACSSVVVLPPRSGRAAVVARNLDYFASDALLRHSMLIVHAPRPGRAGFVAVGWPGLAGQLTALSEDGLFASLHDVPLRVPTRTAVTPRVCALEAMLTTAPRAREDRAEDLATFLRGHRFGMGGNVLAAWPTGAAVFELDGADKDGGVTVRRPDAEAAWLACTNHFRARSTPVRCSRYAALVAALGDAEDVVRAADLAELIRAGEVKLTLHQVVADLGAMTVQARVRRRVRGEAWSESGVVSVREWIERAAAHR